MGEPVAPLERLEPSDKRGTLVRFWPSEETFSDIEFHYEILGRRLPELSSLTSGVKNTVLDERDEPSRDTFQYEGGIHPLPEHMAQQKTHLHPTVLSVTVQQHEQPMDDPLQAPDRHNQP